MRRIRLTKRLRTLAELARGAGVVADIGCDHGRLAVALLTQYEVTRVVAADISPAAVVKTLALARRCGVSEARLEARVQDGLGGMAAGDARAIVLAGMGGELIASILGANLDFARSCELIMQPMRGVEELRGFLAREGFAVYDERVLVDGGRFYQVIAARFGELPRALEWYPGDYPLLGELAFVNTPAEATEFLEARLRGCERRLALVRARNSSAPALEAEAEGIRRVLALVRSQLLR
ncbi:MAG: class I SAM-dependent methyltransferase [Clostridia bacterium]|nr:class I SAM-dependent methyltransferase [Clostridia bacterium]